MKLPPAIQKPRHGLAATEQPFRIPLVVFFPGLGQQPHSVQIAPVAGADCGRVRLRGGDSGDLYIQVALKHHPHFERQGRDLLYDCQVAVWQAALGGEMDVPVIEGGRIKIKMPQGTQHGKVFRVHGQGMPSTNSKERGDLLVKVKLEVPHDLSPRQRELFEELAKIAGHEAPAEEKDKSFFKKILG